ncbi:MAG: hypothetical protein AAB460_01520 [Patescibacteria group bacterium]
MSNHFSEKITRALGSPASLAIHTILFIGVFFLPYLGFSFDRVLLGLTTIVSLEAIYLSLFIQMTVNRNTESLQGVEEEIGEIQEDIGEITEDIDELYQEEIENQEAEEIV